MKKEIIYQTTPWWLNTVLGIWTAIYTIIAAFLIGRTFISHVSINPDVIEESFLIRVFAGIGLIVVGMAVDWITREVYYKFSKFNILAEYNKQVKKRKGPK